MAGLKSVRFIVGFALMALVIPAMAAAQSSTFVVPFDRTGEQGTRQVTQIDPLTGQSTTIAVDTGAFLNPCTAEFVNVTGHSTISTSQSLDKFGVTKINVTVITKGTGAGWVGSALAPTFTGAIYSFNESQSFNVRMPSTGQEFLSDFSDKISMRGAKSIDNWTIRANFRLRVDAAGIVKVELIKLSGDICKG
jgi:hypothetical protein